MNPTLTQPMPGEAVVPATVAPARRLPVRAWLYGVAGLLLTAYVANTTYHRVWLIEVDAASVVAPTAQLNSPYDGVLSQVHVAEGARVEAGQPLYRVESPEVRADLDDATLAVAAAELEVRRLQAAKAAEQVRLDIHGRLLRQRVASQAAQVALLEQRVGIAGRQVERMVELAEGGVVSRLVVEESQSLEAALTGEWEVSRTLLATERGRLSAARRGYYFDGDQVRPGLPEVEAALGVAQEAARLEHERFEALRRRAEETETVRAPFSGRVASVSPAIGAPVREGAVVLRLEREDERLVEAWLTRDEAHYVRIGDASTVEVPGLGRTYDAVVRDIETGPEVASRLAASGLDPRMRVLLALGSWSDEPELAEEAERELLDVGAVGLPAVVSFARSWR